MRILLLCCLLATPAFAQEPFTVIASSPAPGDSMVTHVLPRFTFSAPVDTARRFSNGLPIAFFQPYADIDSLTFSDDLRTATVWGRPHEINDQVWIVTGAYDLGGRQLCSPYVLPFTVAPWHGTGIVSGVVSLIIAVKTESCFPSVVAALFDQKPEAGVRVVAAAAVGEDSRFRIESVRSRTYWPAALYDADLDGQLSLDPAAGEYVPFDPDYDGIPSAIQVTDTSHIDLLITWVGGATEQNADLPGTANLLPNYPNPFNPQTTLAFELERPAALRLSIHDALGREVAVLAEGAFPTGRHEVSWQAADLPSGVYFVRLRGDAFTLSRKLLLSR